MKEKKTSLTKAGTLLTFIFRTAENFFKPFKTRFHWSKKRYNEIEFKKVNNIMKKHYKHPELMINDYDKIEYFDFYSRYDRKKINGLIYLKNPHSKKWIVATHWFAGSKFFGLFHTKMFTEMGYNILAFDFRNHGLSEKTNPTLGLKESWDLLGALDWLKETYDPEIVGLSGISMGAFVVNYFGLKYPEEAAKFNVKFGISEATFGSIETLLKHTRDVRFPWLVRKKKVPKFITKTIQKINQVEQKTGIDMYDVNLFKLLDGTTTLPYPVLFIHSPNDKFAPLPDSYEILLRRRRINSNDRLHVYNYCTHTQALRIHFNDLVKRSANFVAKVEQNPQLVESLFQNWKIK